jgi:putative RNA 2'-phosphotransferase
LPVERDPLSRTLAHLLRHEPGLYGVRLDAKGFAELDEVVSQLRLRRYPEITREDVVAAVREDPRGRFELRTTKVRAKYGHSLPLAVGRVEEPPPVLYAAVPRRRFRDAAVAGLKPLEGRAFVHLAANPDEAREVARRKDPEPVLFEVRAREAKQSKGLTFRHSGSLWLVDEVPPEFLRARG